MFTNDGELRLEGKAEALGNREARWFGHAGSSGTRDRARRRGLRWLVGWIEQGRSQGGIRSDGGGDGTNS